MLKKIRNYDLRQAQDVLATQVTSITSTRYTAYKELMNAMKSPLKIGYARSEKSELEETDDDKSVSPSDSDEDVSTHDMVIDEDLIEEENEAENSERIDKHKKSKTTEKKKHKTKKTRKEKGKEKTKSTPLDEPGDAEPGTDEDKRNKPGKKSKSKRSAAKDTETSTYHVSKSKRKSRKSKKTYSEELGEFQDEQGDADFAIVDIIEGGVQDASPWPSNGGKASAKGQPKSNPQAETSTPKTNTEATHLLGLSSQPTSHKGKEPQIATGSLNTQANRKKDCLQVRHGETWQLEQPSSGSKRVNPAGPYEEFTIPSKKMRFDPNTQDNQPRATKISKAVDNGGSSFTLAKASTTFALNDPFGPMRRNATPGPSNTRAPSGRYTGASSLETKSHRLPKIKVEENEEGPGLHSTPVTSYHDLNPQGPNRKSHHDNQAAKNLLAPPRGSFMSTAGATEAHEDRMFIDSGDRRVNPGQTTTAHWLPSLPDPSIQWTPKGERSFKCKWCKRWYKESRNSIGACRSRHSGKRFLSVVVEDHVWVVQANQ